MRKSKILISVISLSIVCACAEIKTKRPSQTYEQKAGATFDTSENESAPQSTAPVLVGEPRKVAVVFGPGAAKTFTYPNVLKALMQKRINIQRVVGIEWGALTAGFYALSGKPHEAEWKLYKFDPKILDAGGIFSRTNSVKVSELDSYLKENLTTAKTSSLPISFSCPALSLKRGAVTYYSDLPLWAAVRLCLASPPKISPVGDWAPSMMSLHEVAETLKKEGYNTIILVNALGGSELFGSKDKSLSWSEKMYWLEVRRQLWAAKSYYTDVIDIDTKGFSLFDFAAKKELSVLGQKAGDAAANQIVSKYGL